MKKLIDFLNKLQSLLDLDDALGSVRCVMFSNKTCYIVVEFSGVDVCEIRQNDDIWSTYPISFLNDDEEVEIFEKVHHFVENGGMKEFDEILS